MRFTTSTFLAVAAAPLLALAQGGDSNGSNPFNIPPESLNTEAGASVDLTWKPTTDGTVTIYLRSGASNDLNKGVAIASGIDNSGSFNWQVPDDIVRGSNYALEIVDDSDDSNTNYTPPFVIESTNNAAPSVSSSASASSTGSSSSASETETETDTESTATSTGSDSSSATSAAASATHHSNSTSSMATSTSSRSGASSTSASDADATGAVEASEGGAARTTTFAGLIGLVALGAFAL